MPTATQRRQMKTQTPPPRRPRLEYLKIRWYGAPITDQCITSRGKPKESRQRTDRNTTRANHDTNTIYPYHPQYKRSYNRSQGIGYKSHQGRHATHTGKHGCHRQGPSGATHTGRSGTEEAQELSVTMHDIGIDDSRIDKGIKLKRTILRRRGALPPLFEHSRQPAVLHSN